jgi:hypothetical protein
MSRRWRRIRSILVVLLLSYVTAFWIVGCADYLILHPTTNEIPMKWGRRDLVDTPAGRLEFWHAETRIRGTSETQAYVLDLSPNAGRAEYGLLYGVGKWEGLPIDYWAYNYPGYGGTPGSATLRGVHQSALAAYDHLATIANGKPIFLSGYSLGTAAALHVAANRKVAGVYLIHPPPLRQLIVGKYGWWNLWLAAYPISRQIPDELDSLANGARCTAPAVIVIGQRDTFVDTPYQQRVANAYAGQKLLLPLPIDHNDDAEQSHGQVIRDAIRWLWDHSMPSSATQPDR